jgi:hypothetical protein
MAAELRVPISVAAELIASIDQLKPDREAFVAGAIRNELARRGRGAQVVVHPETLEPAEVGFDEWAAVADESDAALIDPSSVVSLDWDAHAGWVRGDG